MAGLTLLILVPLVGALAVSVLPKAWARVVALLSCVASLAVTAGICRDFDFSSGVLQSVERHAWIPAIGAEYFLGADGLSLMLLALASLIVPFALCSGRAGRGYCALMLLVQAALYGTFTAQNFLLWFLFYEMSLLPAFLLIKLWGGAGRDGAAMKFFLFTFLGSVGMLLGFLAIYLATGTLDFVQLAELGRNGGVAAAVAAHFNPGMVWLVCGGVFVGLAVKVPLVPLHSWLPDAYASAPAGVTMILTGLLSKMGVYGFLRLLLPLFPAEMQRLGWWLPALALVSVLLSSLAAWRQKDVRRVFAYLSVSHLGLCLLGLFALGASGTRSAGDGAAVFGGVFAQIFNHGLTAAALFYFAGLLESRRGSAQFADFGGLMQRAPKFCGWMSVALFSSLGLPGLNGFPGEFLIFKGAFGLAPVLTGVATVGLLFNAAALLRVIRKLFSGPAGNNVGDFSELSGAEKGVVIPVSLLMLALGVAPQLLFRIFNATVTHMAQLFIRP